MYDFYLRAYCNGSSSWSDWAGPYTYTATNNQYLCLAPTSPVYGVVRNGVGQAVGATFEWGMNGENVFEYTYVLPSQSVTAGTVNSISNAWPTLHVAQNTNYHFYVRAVCVDGGKTAWTGPIVFNIGQ